MDYEIFQDLIGKYAQDATNPNQGIDPTQLQVGQQVYSPEGDALVVVENPADTTTTTLMPADQANPTVPEGVQTVEDTELSSQYSLQPANGVPAPVAKSRKAQEEPTVDWRDIRDIANDMNTAIESEDMQRLLESLEDMFNIAMLNVNVPEDMEIG